MGILKEVIIDDQEAMFGDGDDGGGTYHAVVIKPVLNGYYVVFSEEDGDYEYVFTDKKEMMEFVGSLV